MIIVATGIRIFASYPEAVEKYYAEGVYPHVSAFQRMLFGWIPLSIGDIFYLFAGLYLLYSVINFIRRIINRKADRRYLQNVAANFVTAALAVYVVFNLFWGLNYNRLGIDYQLKLDKLDYSNDDLTKVTRLVAEKVNELQPASKVTRPQLKRKRYLFNNAVAAYRNLAVVTPDLHYRIPSVKPSIFSYLGNYLGFTGYYNPFSGEAQVNTTVPLFVRPFTTCHEIGHQLGYAKESEANFAGYLSATASHDSAFLYSVYFEMLAYASRYLYYSDSLALKDITAQLSPAVKGDIKELRDFYKRYKSPVETAIDRLYSQYLKANQQPSGKMSYNEVVAMLIAHYKKTGKI